jgi:hypothetical protein
MSQSSRVARHIAVMQAALQPNAIVYRAIRNDDRPASSFDLSEWDKRSDIPSNFNWYLYDYRVVTKPVFDFDAIWLVADRIRELAQGGKAGAFDDDASAVSLIKAEVDLLASKL